MLFRSTVRVPVTLTDPAASGSVSVTGTRTVLSRPTRLLLPSPRVSFGSAARSRPALLNRYRCGPRHNGSIPPPCSVGFVPTRSPACKPAIRFASFSGETDSGCWWIDRFIGRERRSHISSWVDNGPVVAQASARIPRKVGASADILRDDEAQDYFNLRSCCAIRMSRASLRKDVR